MFGPDLIIRLYFGLTLTALCRIDFSRVLVAIRRSGSGFLGLLIGEGTVERSVNKKYLDVRWIEEGRV